MTTADKKIMEQFAGMKRDEYQEEGIEPNDEHADIRTGRTVRKRRKRLWVIIAMVLCGSIGLGFSYLGWHGGHFAIHEKKVIRRVQIEATCNRQLIPLESFVIPLKGNIEFTYMSMSISLNVTDNNVKREIREKEAQLRGIIYDDLENELGRSNEVASLERLKHVIVRGANRALSAGKVQGVYITHLLFV